MRRPEGVAGPGHVPRLQLALEVSGGEGALAPPAGPKGAALQGVGLLRLAHSLETRPVQLIHLQRPGDAGVAAQSHELGRAGDPSAGSGAGSMQPRSTPHRASAMGSRPARSRREFSPVSITMHALGIIYRLGETLAQVLHNLWAAHRRSLQSSAGHDCRPQARRWARSLRAVTTPLLSELLLSLPLSVGFTAPQVDR